MGGRRGEIDVIFIGFRGELEGFYYTIHVVLIMGKISDILAGPWGFSKSDYYYYFPIKTTRFTAIDVVGKVAP